MQRDSGLSWKRARVGIVALALASLAVQAGFAQRTSLALVSTAWSPFTNDDGADEPRHALDLVEAALGRIDVDATTAIVPAAEFTAALLEGRYDGSAAAWKDAERERVLVFSNPYLENRLILVGRRGSDVSAATLATLKGQRVAVVEGYSYGDGIEASGPVFVRTASVEAGLRQMLDGGVDYTLIDELVVRYIVSNYPEQAAARMAFGSVPLVVRPLYLAIRRTRPDAEAIVARFNAQLGTMIADGTYHRLVHVDWIRADVDGDGLVEYVAQSGNLYRDWASVPESYRVPDTEPPSPDRSSASIFTFTW